MNRPGNTHRGAECVPQYTTVAISRGKLITRVAAPDVYCKTLLMIFLLDIKENTREGKGLQRVECVCVCVYVCVSERDRERERERAREGEKKRERERE